MGFRNEEAVTPKGRLAPKNLKASYLLSAGYDGKQEKAFLRLYEPESQQIYLWYDNTGHISYCISKLQQDELEQNRELQNFKDYRGVHEEQKYDAIIDEPIIVSKVLASNPLAIGGGRGGGIRNILGDSWESRIRYYQSYIYDNGLIPGMPYKIVDGNLEQVNYELPESIRSELNIQLAGQEQDFREHMLEWARLLQCPVPDIRRVVVDIEVYTSVENRLPNPDEAIERVTAVSFVASDGLRRVILLNDTGVEEPVPEIEGAEVAFYTKIGRAHV